MPTCQLGRLALHEARAIQAADGDFDALPEAHIDAAFDRVQQLRWRQTLALKGALLHLFQLGSTAVV